MKLAIITALCSWFLVLRAHAAEPQNLVRVETLANVSSVEPGKPFNVGVRLRIIPGWHVYWVNAGTGIPTTIKFDLPEGFTASDVRYPTPHRFDMAGGLVAYGYTDDVMLMATITPPKELKPGSDVAIGGKVYWLVCQENCIKGDAPLKLSLKTDAKSQAANEELFARWRAELPQPTDLVNQDAKIDAPGGAFKSAMVTLTADFKSPGAGSPPEKVEWFPATPDQLMVTDDKVKTENGKTIVTFKVDILAGEKFSDPEFPSVLVYTVNGKRIGLSVPIQLKSKS